VERGRGELAATQEAVDCQRALEEEKANHEVEVCDAALEAALAEWIQLVDTLGARETQLASSKCHLAECQADILAKVAGKEVLQAAAMALVEAANKRGKFGSWAMNRSTGR
jgi:hypothetical protein